MLIYETRNNPNRRLSPNFIASEFFCHCKKCDPQIIDMDLVVTLQQYRDQLNKLASMGYIQKIDDKKDIGISLNRGYSCEKHNASIPNAEPDSQHLKGTAGDITFTNIKNPNMMKLAMIAYKVGFTGIGVYDDRLHVDLRTNRDAYNYGFALWIDGSWHRAQGIK